MSEALKERAIESLEFARSMFGMITNGMTDDKACFQSRPSDNHLLWTMGHLAVTDVWVVKMMAGETVAEGLVPETYEKLFGYGSKVESDASVYPSLAEVRGYFESAHNTLIETAKSKSVDQLLMSIEEASGGFMKDGIDGIMKCAWHEGWHTGQLSTLRREMGLGSAFGEQPDPSS
ncbi:MAG: DinB family protein [Planctomycetes bacterium]|nr:DinB family protein [Planctomycetota bacterium]NOG55253.1 DinB family protein [Planctomycetota bacterium]